MVLPIVGRGVLKSVRLQGEWFGMLTSLCCVDPLCVVIWFLNSEMVAGVVPELPAAAKAVADDESGTVAKAADVVVV